MAGALACLATTFLSAGSVEDELPTNRGHLRKEPQRGTSFAQDHTAAQPKVSQSLLCSLYVSETLGRLLRQERVNSALS